MELMVLCINHIREQGSARDMVEMAIFKDAETHVDLFPRGKIKLLV
jgi:hypothetical protein